jgi:hypothetical protein
MRYQGNWNTLNLFHSPSPHGTIPNQLFSLSPSLEGCKEVLWWNLITNGIMAPGAETETPRARS